MIIAIVVAGGSGLRFRNAHNLGLPKQYCRIKDNQIVSLSVASLLNYSCVKAVVLCIRKEDFDLASQIFTKEISEKKVFLTVGGKNRIDSSMNGLFFIEDNFQKNCEFVMIHDAVRPLISQKLLHNLTEEMKKNLEIDGVFPALKVQDALKKVENNGICSVDRNEYMIAQTPQIFRFNKIVDCAKNNYSDKEDNSGLHDEVDFMQRNGYKIGIIEGCRRNIKITQPDDLALAEYFMGLN